MRLGKFIASLIDYAEDERRKLEAGILGTALQILEQPHCTTAVLSASKVYHKYPLSRILRERSRLTAWCPTVTNHPRPSIAS